MHGRSCYGPGTESEIGTLNVVADTGSYLDVTWHRYQVVNLLGSIGLGMQRVGVCRARSRLMADGAASARSSRV